MKVGRLVSFLVGAIIIAACGSTTTSGGNTNTYAGKVIKLGAILSITGAGGVYGPQSRDGMNLAVKQINAGGGILGPTITLTINDDAQLKATAGRVTPASRADHRALRVWRAPAGGEPQDPDPGGEHDRYPHRP